MLPLTPRLARTDDGQDVFEPAKKKKKQKTAKRGLETVDASVAEVRTFCFSLYS